MTAKEIAKRNERAEFLRVLQSEDGQFFVESSEGKILYSVALNDEGTTCPCGDFARNVKKDENFRCKHILSVMNAIPRKEVEGARFLERQTPQLDPRFITDIGDTNPKNCNPMIIKHLIRMASTRASECIKGYV